MVAVLHVGVGGLEQERDGYGAWASHIPQRFCLGWLLPPFAALSRNRARPGQASPYPNPTGPGSQPCPSHEDGSGAATFLPRALGKGRELCIEEGQCSWEKGVSWSPFQGLQSMPEDTQCYGLGAPKGRLGPDSSWVSMVLLSPEL